ncbi:hypothetical protein ULMA_00380 [Patiriisocius marinus]|uniref:TonB-dependent receptor-like beta-barrel domain-containing protein n=1 Tax=Patiriisocius marinus TaxID=1397112 RepID=A0A5J4IW08_9FLAO|nr:hypothetical protein ULMA_00380 [Patiriisocius marinus]
MNNAVIRNVNSYSNNNSLTIKSGFFGIFNFENTITNTNLKFKAINNSEIYGITNNLHLYIKPKDRIKLGATLENYHPDLNSSSNFYFLDFDLSYTSISKKFTYSIISKNITSQNAIIENNLINDILESNRSYTINNPFLLFKIEFSL